MKAVNEAGRGKVMCRKTEEWGKEKNEKKEKAD